MKGQNSQDGTTELNRSELERIAKQQQPQPKLDILGNMLTLGASLSQTLLSQESMTDYIGDEQKTSDSTAGATAGAPQIGLHSTISEMLVSALHTTQFPDEDVQQLLIDMIQKETQTKVGVFQSQATPSVDDYTKQEKTFVEHPLLHEQDISNMWVPLSNAASHMTSEQTKRLFQYSCKMLTSPETLQVSDVDVPFEHERETLEKINVDVLEKMWQVKIQQANMIREVIEKKRACEIDIIQKSIKLQEASAELKKEETSQVQDTTPRSSITVIKETSQVQDTTPRSSITVIKETAPIIIKEEAKSEVSSETEQSEEFETCSTLSESTSNLEQEVDEARHVIQTGLLLS